MQRMSKSEALWVRKPTQVAPQQKDIDKIATHKDEHGRKYAFWEAKNPMTSYLDSFVQDQLHPYKQKANVGAVFAARHKAETLPGSDDKLVLQPIKKEGASIACTVLSSHAGGRPYVRARKSTLLIVQVKI